MPVNPDTPHGEQTGAESTELRCLTVRQPWSWAIMFGGKTVENRTWLPRHRGELAIHAGAADSRRGKESPLVQHALWRHSRSAPQGRAWQHLGRGADTFVHGAVLGTVDLVDAHRAEQGCCDSPWAEYRVFRQDERRPGQVAHWELANPRPIPPLPHRGRLGLWRVPAEVADEVLALRSYQDGDDARWYARTGHCGTCGNPGNYCTCTAAEPCGCRELHAMGSGIGADAAATFGAEAELVGEQDELFDLTGPVAG